jgi:nitrate reductase alpha subunit
MTVPVQQHKGWLPMIPTHHKNEMYLKIKKSRRNKTINRHHVRGGTEGSNTIAILTGMNEK